MVTTDVYTYIGVIVSVLNDGLPRASWLVIGDKATRTVSSRLGLSYTLIIFQLMLGAIMTVVFIAASHQLAAAFVPAQVRNASITYVQISSVSALSSAIQVAVSDCTRALDSPDVPLLISSTSVVINIILDLLIISRFHVGNWNPNINYQALIRLACDMSSAIAGLAYFAFIARKMYYQSSAQGNQARPGFKAFKVLARPSVYTFAESAIRNSLYLWLVSTIIKLGENYGTAFGVFNTIRFGLVMVPVQALEASTLTFVGHNWGRWRARAGANLRRPRASKNDLAGILQPAFISCAFALIIEVPICICLSLWGMESFAYYLSGSREVAILTRKLWKNIDWCYIFYAVQYQLAAILLATSPRWYLYQALGSNFLWIFPWAIVVTKADLSDRYAWTYYSVIFGGAVVFDFFNVGLVVLFWAWRLTKGKVKFKPVHSTL